LYKRTNDLIWGNKCGNGHGSALPVINKAITKPENFHAVLTNNLI